MGVAILAFRLPIFSSFLYAPHDVAAFGTVPAGQVVKASFVVRNLHPWAVTVKEVRGGCGCTRTVLEHDPPFRLAPFQAVTVSANLDTDRKNGPTSQTIHVVTSDNSVGSPLTLEGMVLPAPSPSASVKER